MHIHVHSLMSSIFCFLECSGVTNITVGNDTSDEQFTVSTSSAQLVVKSELDYETTTSYYFLMTVVDKGLSPELTGYIAIRVKLPKSLKSGQQNRLLHNFRKCLENSKNIEQTE